MQKCPSPYTEMTPRPHLVKITSSTGRTTQRKKASDTRRSSPRWNSMNSSRSTSPTASGKSIRIYTSGIWQASATSTPQRYQRTTRYSPLAFSSNAPSPTEIRLTARPHMKKLITWSMYRTRQSIIPTRYRR